MAPTVFNFCTYFDRHYWARGLAMIHSLAAHCQPFKIWVLCMDDETYHGLAALRLPEVQAIRLQDFERGDDALSRAKQTRSRLEYYFTCTPTLPIFVLEHWPEVELITYLDADIFFFADPAPIFAELGEGSIAVVRQRVSPPHQQTSIDKFGVFTVSWVSFRRDASGWACLHWWRERCLEWCFNRFEDNKHGDQKYLDDWPVRFSNVIVLEHKGADLARWNVNNYQIRVVDAKTVIVDEQPLIFYHFSGLTQVAPGLYNPRFGEDIRSPDTLRRYVYAPYLGAITQFNRTLANKARPTPLNDASWLEMRRVLRQPRNRNIVWVQLHRVLSIGWSILVGRYMFYWSGRIVWPRVFGKQESSTAGALSPDTLRPKLGVKRVGTAK